MCDTQDCAESHRTDRTRRIGRRHRPALREERVPCELRQPVSPEMPRRRWRDPLDLAGRQPRQPRSARQRRHLRATPGTRLPAGPLGAAACLSSGPSQVPDAPGGQAWRRPFRADQLGRGDPHHRRPAEVDHRHLRQPGDLLPIRLWQHRLQPRGPQCLPPVPERDRRLPGVLQHLQHRTDPLCAAIHLRRRLRQRAQPEPRDRQRATVRVLRLQPQRNAHERRLRDLPVQRMAPPQPDAHDLHRSALLRQHARQGGRVDTDSSRHRRGGTRSPRAGCRWSSRTRTPR